MVVRGNPRFRCLLESEIPAFEVERLLERASGLAESTVDQGLKGRGSPVAGTLATDRVAVPGKDGHPTDQNGLARISIEMPPGRNPGPAIG